MALFENVASHPVFRKTVKEVLYDARLFEFNMLDESRYFESFYCEINPLRRDLDEKLGFLPGPAYEGSHSRYRRFFHEK